MTSDLNLCDPPSLDTLLFETLGTHKAGQIGLAAARSALTLRLLQEAGAQAVLLASPHDTLQCHVEQAFDRILMEHRAGHISRHHAARRLQHLIRAAENDDVAAVQAAKLPVE